MRYALLWIGIIGLCIWSYTTTLDAPTFTEQPVQRQGFTPQWGGPIPTLTSATSLPQEPWGGPCRYYTGTEYGTVDAVAVIRLLSIEDGVATWERTVYWPDKRYPNNAFDDTQGVTRYVLRLPDKVRIDLPTAISGERYEWEAANE